MRKCEVSVVIGVRMAINFPDPDVPRLSAACIGELTLFSGIFALRLMTDEEVPIRISYLPRTRDLPEVAKKYMRREHRKKLKPEGYLVFEATAEFDPENENVVNQDPSLSMDDKVFFCQDMAISNLYAGICNLCMIANLAKPASLVSLCPILLVDGEFWEGKPDHIFELAMCTALSKERGWPSLQELRIADAWKWAQSIPQFNECAAASPCGRALAAFSHLIIEQPSDSSPLNILWLLMALEALYSDGHEALKFQLRAKAEALLGKPEKFKKMLGVTYDFRSSLVHGGVNLPFRHAPWDWVDETYSKMIDSVSIATAVLIATFQKMITENMTELSFEYGLSKAKIPSNSN